MFTRKKTLIICIAIPIMVGAVSGVLSFGGMREYMQMPQPPLSPPPWVFPIVWTILYTLMGLASYYIVEAEHNEKGIALTLYNTQLIFNFFWSLIFFNLKNYLLSLVWLIAMWCLIAGAAAVFYRIKKKAAYLMLPYVAWTTFAVYLTYQVYRMYG